MVLTTVKGLVIPIMSVINVWILCATERHCYYCYSRKTHKILTFSYLGKKFIFKIAPSDLASKLNTDAL